MYMEWILAYVAIALLVSGLVGQGFEMQKIRRSITSDESISSGNIFTDKRNFKWYAIIATSIIIWYIAEYIP